MTTTPEQTPEHDAPAAEALAAAPAPRTAAPHTAGTGRTAAATPEARTVEIPGVPNVRDLGGLEAAGGTIRRGLLLRSAAFEDLAPQGADVLVRLGVRTIIDLRLPAERAARPSRVHGFSGLAGVAEVRIPLVPDFEGSPDTAEGSYVFMVERGAPNIGAVIARLAEPGSLPAIVHCAAGKDRTGLVVAALLSTLGVPIAQVHADFLRSNEALGERLVYPAQASALDAALARMAETAGSVQGFLERNGVAPQALAALHARLLEQPSGTPLPSVPA